jgi:hydroxypyruvate isomerase
MPRFSANISMMFCEYVFLDRFSAARDAGFEAVEFLFPYDYTPDEIGRAVSQTGLAISVFNFFPGNWQAGERGMAAIPGREAEFQATVKRALPYAREVGAKCLHMMAGLALPDAKTEAVYLDNIRYAGDTLAEAGLDLLIEPINSRSMPGYFLSTVAQAIDLINQVSHPNVRLQFDIFHHQIMQGDVVCSLSDCIGQIGHIQIASVPERQEPDRGELNYQAVFAHLDHLGYDGWLGCEYHPRGKTEDGLSWLPSPT